MRKYKKPFLFICVLVITVFYYNALPDKLFEKPSSTVLVASNGNMLGAKIAADGQWRFPHSDSVPDKFKVCITTFEDRFFYYHPGFNPYSFVRALASNIKDRRIVSGGSTISMQVVRMMRNNRKRTVREKITEVILTTRLELRYSKNSILALYASNAPMGGNVVGLEAAAWRYYGRPASQLSWGETATLAVLPNSPSLIYPGKNQEKLMIKRNRLLDKLKNKGVFCEMECALAKAEPLPGSPLPLPALSPHLLEKAIKDGYQGKYVISTINFDLQKKTNEVLSQHHRILKANEINNIAALILETNTGNVLAYAGNVPGGNRNIDGFQVDIIQSERSPGSLFKPVLFAAVLEEGNTLPNSLVPDIPTNIGGYAPVNFNRTYDGAVPAKKAMSRSLNVPAVRMLMVYGIEKFNHILKKAGIRTLYYPPSHYGLSIILGGWEATLWDMCGMYASMARELNYYDAPKGLYKADTYFMPAYIDKGSENNKSQWRNRGSLFSAGTLWAMFEAMVEVARPEADRHWQRFSSSQKIAWKTGTSFGYRDGWSIGVTPEYVVGVWTGNASGEGRPGLVGLYTAAPVMFDIFKHLRAERWFDVPHSELEKIETCAYSGYKASELCEKKTLTVVPKSTLNAPVCPFHIRVHLDKTESFRVNSDCENISEIKQRAWFVLPPVQESYFKPKNTFYKTLPPYRSDCLTAHNFKNMAFVYPEANAKILIPKELDGTPGKTVFKVVHRNKDAVLYWHLNTEYIGTTKNFHHIAITPYPGTHTVSVVDDTGQKILRKFQVVN